MSDAGLTFRPAFELRELIAARRVSPVELTEACLRRIEALNPHLNAFLTVAGTRAADEARQAEQSVMRGDNQVRLLGIPISIKDLEPVAGMPCTRGSLVFRDYVPDYDEIAVARLRAAGAIVVGKTNTPEFGRLGTTENRLGEDCRNPWNPDTTTGGSSGGAAASVAAGMVPIAQGSDGGGSIRIPSSFCGLVGIKATQGRIPRRGQGLLSWHPINFSSVGPMTRTVRDAALLLDLTAGPAPDAEPGTLPVAPSSYEAVVIEASANPDVLKGLRVAWTPDFGTAAVDPEVAAAVQASVEVLGRLGAQVVDAPIEINVDWLWQAYFTITAVKTSQSFGKLLDQKREQLTDYVIGDISLGRRVTADRYHRALCEIEQHRAAVEALFEHCDILATPTTSVTAFPHRKNPGVIGGKHVDRRWGFYPFTFPFNVSGHPAANVPCGFSKTGMPMGMQLVGRRGDEVTILKAAAAFEAVMPWSGYRPPEALAGARPA